MGNPSSNNSSILLITPLHIQHPSAKMDNAAAAVSKLFGAGSTTNDAEQPTSSTPSTTANDTAGYQSSIDEKKFESSTKEPTIVDEHVHHHLHETIQPVI